MESGAFAGAPVETEQLQTPPEPVTPEGVAAEMNAVEAEPTTEQVAEPSVQSTLDEMRQKLDAVLEQQQPAPQATGLLDALNEEPEYEDPAEAAEPTYEDPAAQQQMEVLRGLIREEAQQIVSPIQQERRDEQLGALEQKYPDITSEPVMARLKPAIESLVQRTGNESIKDDPAVVLMAYQAVKAQMADADAVPAESAAGQGASLETHSGVGTAQAGEPSIEDYYKKNVFQRAKSDL